LTSVLANNLGSMRPSHILMERLSKQVMLERTFSTAVHAQSTAASRWSLTLDLEYGSGPTRRDPRIRVDYGPSSSKHRTLHLLPTVGPPPERLSSRTMRQRAFHSTTSVSLRR